MISYEIYPQVTREGLKYGVRTQGGMFHTVKHISRPLGEVDGDRRFSDMESDFASYFMKEVYFDTPKKAVKAVQELRGSDARVVFWSA